MIQEMERLVREKDICVLATAAGGRPHCSLMAYVVDEACREIHMTTFRDTTKYRNLLENPSVSLLIDTREEHTGARRPQAKALTVAGSFEEIRDQGKQNLVRAQLLERHPHLREIVDHPDAVLVGIRISSFLLLDGLTKSRFVEV